MKRILLALFLLLSVSSNYAQDTFTLSLELVTPSGKIDSKSYFLARLKNHNDSLSMFIGYAGSYPLDLRFSYLRIIYDRVGGSGATRDEAPFFDYDEKKAILIKPASEYQVKLPLFMYLDEMGGNGILPRVEKSLSEIKRVRIKLEKLEYQPLMVGSSDLKHFYGKKSVDLYSNWVDVNGTAFISLLRQGF